MWGGCAVHHLLYGSPNLHRLPWQVVVASIEAGRRVSTTVPVAVINLCREQSKCTPFSKANHGTFAGFQVLSHWQVAFAYS